MWNTNKISQNIEEIPVKNLVLWTENPRDPIDSLLKDQDIVDRALQDKKSKWELSKLVKEMGDYYDFSELPIVVYEKGKYIVLDGNRRIILAKIKLGYVSSGSLDVDDLPSFPKSLPCNICSMETALQLIYRKHVTNRNTWLPLERDIFVSKFMGQKKSIFLLFDEATGGYISDNPELNQGFVRDEILSEKNLDKLGFKFIEEKLQTNLSNEEVNIILDDILRKIREKQISTRTSRGDIFSVLEQRSKEIINSHDNDEFHYYSCHKKNNVITQKNEHDSSSRKKTRISKKSNCLLFGEKLVLKQGNINDLYSDIFRLYEYTEKNKTSFSHNVYSIFRMSLRLICETASKDLSLDNIEAYITYYFEQAKSQLNKNMKTYLFEQNISRATIVQLLNTGAHNYLSSSSQEKLLGLSIALGAMLRLSHGK